ncbi:hypothetical protein ACP70R_033788 [Stipagrostis hirtigluma subsp. patula]
MGGLAEGAAGPEMEPGSAAVDVSAPGTLVWLRRPNGTWWPSIVISPLQVPDGCAAPPRCPATPVMLLGRRHGPAFVDWCNLERCKRVKPFRCGEVEFEQRIASALAMAATHKTAKPYKGRYARMEDAVLEALDVERTRALEAQGKSRQDDGCSSKPSAGNGVARKSSSSSHAAARGSSAVIIQPPSPKRKRKTPNDSEDDAPKGCRRMRDLRDIGSKTVPTDTPNAGTISVLSLDLPSVSQLKRSKQSHATAKRKHATADQDQPCGSSRKKDRSRPLSELCNGDSWNGFRTNGQKADERSVAVGGCSSSSSGTSSLDTSLQQTGSHRSSALKTCEAKRTETSCMTGLLYDDFPHGEDFVQTPLIGGSISEADHLQTYQTVESTKYPTWKQKKQPTDCSEAGKSSQCERRNFKVKTICSIDQDGNNRTRDSLEHEQHKKRTVKHKASGNEVVLLEKKPAKHSLNKVAEPGVSMHLAAPAGLDCVGAFQQQLLESKCGSDESSQTIREISNCENGSVSSLVCELPLQICPPQQRAPSVEKRRAGKPVKTLQLNSILYDVELIVQGTNNNGRRVPLVSLMSKWNHRPVVGYPVSVEVLDDVFCRQLSNTGDHQPGTSSANGLLKKGKTEGLQCTMPSSRGSRSKTKSRRKTLGKEEDKLWQPHTKKIAYSPRKMRRISSFVSSQRDGNTRKSVVGKFSGPAIACIPLRVVFSRIKEALSYPAK